MKYFIYIITFLFISFLSFASYHSSDSRDAKIKNSSPRLRKQKGVCWVAGPNRVDESDFLPLIHNNIQWINQTPFAFQRDVHSPDLVFFTEDRVWWGETDAGIRTITRMAKEIGVKSMLKPHIWITRPTDEKWRADIRMLNELDWQTWFENYRKFILHHARLASENQIEILCIGTELHQTVSFREEDWRRLIKEIRQEYKGFLTYAANWYQEFQEVPFWDEMDFIGIQAYFPLTDRQYPTLEELMQGWKQHLEAIEAVQQKHDKPVIFTEIGYKSTAETAVRPWEWLRPFSGQPTTRDLEAQANCYEAFFRTFWDKDWFQGVYFWKWFPEIDRRKGLNKNFTPQDKPAQVILAKWYAK